MKNGSNFTDLGKESAVCGAIAAGTFEIIPEAALIPPDAFVDPRWRIIYSVACALRSQISDKLVCPESVCDYIAFHGLDRELQTAIDSTKSIHWHRWPEFVDTSQAFSSEGLSLRYSLSELDHLYHRRQVAKLGTSMADGSIDEDAAFTEFEAIRNAAAKNGHLSRSLMNFSELSPDPNDTLLGNRFLCREGGMLFVGPSGIGKTAASVQQDLLWSMGLPAFGIRPLRPLKILTIQAEDDDGDLHEIVSGIMNHRNFTPEQIELSRANCSYVAEKTLTGTTFINQVVSSLLTQFKPDILRINPLQAYLGGDIKDPEITAAFLRNGLNPLLVTHKCAAILVHHTPKTNFRDTKEWKSSDWMYAGAGSADITNWARAALIIDPTDDPHVFAFIAAKRGSRIGWADDNGDSATIRHFSHSVSSDIYWRDTDESEVPKTPRNEAGVFQKKFTPDDILEIMSALDPLETDHIRAKAYKDRNMSRATFFRLWEPLKTSGKITCTNGKWLRA